MRLASLNPIAAIGRAFASHANVLLHDAMRGVGAKVHGSEARTIDYLRGLEERVMGELAAIRAEQADFRARHGFIGDPVAQSPAVSAAGEPLVPRREPTLEQRGRANGIVGRGDPRLPAGRPHP